MPSTFDGLLAYRNGVKGAIFTQVGDDLLGCKLVTSWHSPHFSKCCYLHCDPIAHACCTSPSSHPTPHQVSPPTHLPTPLQVNGAVMLNNTIAADNGAGPLMHKVNGKDTGGNLEFTWIVDDRPRPGTELASMAGVQNALVLARTNVSRTGTLDIWNGGRWGADRWCGCQSPSAVIHLQRSHPAAYHLL